MKEKLEAIILRIAYANNEFVCMQCLRTIEQLLDMLSQLDSAYAEEVRKESERILYE